MADLRDIGRPFVAEGPTGVSIRDRLKGLTTEDEKVLRLVGAHLGTLASPSAAGTAWSIPPTRGRHGNGG